MYNHIIDKNKLSNYHLNVKECKENVKKHRIKSYAILNKEHTKIPRPAEIRIKADNNGIGYISLASLSDSGLKGLSYEGVAPTEAGVVDGTYKLQRNFNYISRAESDCTADEWNMIQCFLA